MRRVGVRLILRLRLGLGLRLRLRLRLGLGLGLGLALSLPACLPASLAACYLCPGRADVGLRSVCRR